MTLRSIFTMLSFVTFTISSTAQTFPVTNLKVSGRKDNRYNIVIVPDGYLSSQLPTFLKQADTIRQKVFTYSPFKEYINFFNVFCIQVPSYEAGVNHPATATDIKESIGVISVNNYFRSAFDWGGIHRLLFPNKSLELMDVLTTNIPEFDLPYLLSNTDIYGGAGGYISTGTMNIESYKIAVHEWGHSFARLADEYWAGTRYAKESPNMTRDSDPSTVKWKNWIGHKGVGVYHYGISDEEKSWFKPHSYCLMETLMGEFCSVCKEAIVEQIYRFVNPIDSVSPNNSTTIDFASSPLSFKAYLIRPVPNTFIPEWTLNGMPIPFADDYADITDVMLKTGINELKLTVTDFTSLSRTYRPADGYQFTTKWQINKSTTGISEVSAAENGRKFFYKIFPVPANGLATFEYENFGEPIEAQYTILDLSGRVIDSHTVSILKGKNSLLLNLEGFTPGTYSIKLKSSDLSVAAQIQKQ